MNEHKIPSIVAIFFLIAGLAAGVLLVQQKQYFNASASGDLSPNDVRISNVSSNSFTVSWYTNKDTVGSVYWGIDADTKQSTFDEDVALKKIHYVRISGLQPSTNYYFRLTSGGQVFDNYGVPWTINTTPRVNSSSQPSIITGKVLTESGQPASGVIVYLQTGGAYLNSVQTSKSGVWIFSTSLMTDQSLKDSAKLESDALFNIFVQGASLGTSTAQIHLQDADPMPDITLGKSYDFRNINTYTKQNLPKAEFAIPNQDQTLPKFDVSDTP